MEAIKGQDALKKAVQKLEIELFKDWPKSVNSKPQFGVRIDMGISSFKFTNIQFHGECSISVSSSSHYRSISTSNSDWFII